MDTQHPRHFSFGGDINQAVDLAVTRERHTHTHTGEREGKLVRVLATLPLSLSCSLVCVDVIPGSGVEAGVVEATRHASLVCHRLRPATIIHSTDSLGEAGKAVVAAAATLDSGHCKVDCGTVGRQWRSAAYSVSLL